MKILFIPQADGGNRYVALADRHAETVRRDSAMLDGVPVAAVLDIDSQGRLEWTLPGTIAARAAIVAAFDKEDTDEN